MALQIAETLISREGQELTSFYLRLEPLVCLSGDKVAVEYSHYGSKVAYQNGATTVARNAEVAFEYDRAVNGSDIQQFAHDSLVTYLTTSQGVDNNGDALDPRYSSANVSIVDL